MKRNYQVVSVPIDQERLDMAKVTGYLTLPIASVGRTWDAWRIHCKAQGIPFVVVRLGPESASVFLRLTGRSPALPAPLLDEVRRRYAPLKRSGRSFALGPDKIDLRDLPPADADRVARELITLVAA